MKAVARAAPLPACATCGAPGAPWLDVRERPACEPCALAEMPPLAARRSLLGRVVARLTVVGFAGKHPRSCASLWRCRCACGRVVVVTRGRVLRASTRLSCGCAGAARGAELRLYTHAGVSDSLTGWAARLGVTRQGLAKAAQRAREQR